MGFLDRFRSSDLADSTPAIEETAKPTFSIPGLPKPPNEAQENTATATAAVRTCVSWYGSVLAGAEIEGPSAVTRSFLSTVVQEMLLSRYGRSVWEISITESGELAFYYLDAVQVLGGGHDPARWVVRGSAVGPTGYSYRYVPWNGCVFAVRLPNSPRVWEGKSILPALTSRLMWVSEKRAVELQSSPFGRNAHFKNKDGSGDSNRNMAEQVFGQFPSLTGELVLTFDTAAYEMDLHDLGTDVEKDLNAAVNAAEYASASIRNNALIPPALMSVSDSGQVQTGTREALSQFIDTAAQPLANVVAEELSMKLEEPVSITLTQSTTADTRARARAILDLVKAGMELGLAVENVE